MKAFVYIFLIAFVLWAGATWENAHAPAPVAEAPEQELPIVVPEPEVAVVVKEASTASSLQTDAAPAQDGISYTEEYVEELEQAIHNRVNEERKNQGLKTLAYDSVLAQVAAYHSTDMAKEKYFAHEDEDGCDSACRVSATGYKWEMVGENLFLLKRTEHFTAYGASALVVAGWMGSEGHRRNLFEEDFTHEGIGVVILGDSMYVTEVLTLPR